MAAASAALSALVYFAAPGIRNSEFDAHRFSLATAYSGLALLGLTLAIGPIEVLRRGRVGPLSNDLRRDAGTWAAILGVLHTLYGLTIHFMGQVWPYFLYPAEQQPSFWPLPIRIDPFGIANYTGLVATLIVVLLLGLSNDLSMRALGNRRWKRLQQLNYVLLGLVVIHGILYQRLEERPRSWILVFGLMSATVILVQLVGYWWRRTGRMRSKSARPNLQT